MKTILVANTKGGTGKSTMLVHLAVAAEVAGDGPIAVADTDYSTGLTADWFNKREAATPFYVGVTPRTFQNKLQELARTGVQFLFVDTHAVWDPATITLLADADLILVPLNPNPADLITLNKVLPMLRSAARPFLFILTRVRRNLRNNANAILALQTIDTVAKTAMHERVIYAETFFHGRTAFEIEPKGQTAEEMTALWREVKSRLLEKRFSSK